MLYFCNTSVNKVRSGDTADYQKPELKVAKIICANTFQSCIDTSHHSMRSYRSNNQICNPQLFRVLVKPNRSSDSPPPFISVHLVQA